MIPFDFLQITTSISEFTSMPIKKLGENAKIARSVNIRNEWVGVHKHSPIEKKQQGNYSLRRPPKLIISAMFNEQSEYSKKLY